MTDDEDPNPYTDPNLVHPDILAAALRYAETHAPDLRAKSEQPLPPWPDRDNEMLQFLVHGAMAMLARGDDPSDVILTAVVHGWYEGGLDFAQRIRDIKTISDIPMP